MEEMVEITKAEYELLLATAKFMDCLESAGVDNWEGFEYALDLYNEENDG